MIAKLIHKALVALGFVKHPTVSALQPKIAFYIDAAPHGNHGQIVITNHTYGLKEEPVNFVFIGRREPPPMSLAVIQEIWKQAATQGYYPIEIAHYGTPANSETNALLESIRAGMVRTEQLMQCAGTRGAITAADGELFKESVAEGYSFGLDGKVVLTDEQLDGAGVEPKVFRSQRDNDAV